MTTAIQANERIKQRFTLYDTDHNGAIERADLESEARRIIKAFGASESTPKGAALKDAYLQLWNYMAEKSGVGRNGRLTLDQFTKFAEQHILGPGGGGFSAVLRPTVQAMVNLVDTDGDNKVNPPEFQRWLDAIGVDSASAQEAFQAMDVNNDGYLDTDELVNAVREYHEGKLDVPLLGHPN